MTLLELVVGLAVTGLALAAGYAAFASVIDHRQRAEAATAAIARESAVRQTLASWLAGARLTVEESGPVFQGVDGVHGSHADAELTLMTTAPTPLGVGNTVVRLFIDRDEETPERGLVAELSEWRGAARERVEIEPLAAGLEIRYLSGIHAERQWLASWVSSSVLPAGIEVRLQAAHPDTLPGLLALPVLVSFVGSR
jgi:type II secretory pathway pseudopilin PulG